MTRAAAQAERDLGLLGIFGEETDPGRRLLISCWNELWPYPTPDEPSISSDGPEDVSMLQPSRGDDEQIAAEIIVAQVAGQSAARQSIERFRCSGDWPAERLIGPECGIEQLLHLVLWFVQIHRDFFFDDPALFSDVLRRESRVKQHVHEHIQ